MSSNLKTFQINREVWRLALPNIISNVSVPLLGTVDTALMGRLSAEHLGAVGIGTMVFNFLYWNFGFLRMGTTGMTAQAFGARHRRQMVLTLFRAAVLGLCIALLLCAFQNPLARVAVWAFQVQPEQVGLVWEYFFIRIWAAPAYMVLLCLMGWYFGMQNAVIPLVLTILINVINIAASFWFVRYLDMGIRGVALGTVIAQYVGLFSAILILFMKYRRVLSPFSLAGFFDVEKFRRFLSVNKDLFLRTLLLTFVFAFFYSQSSAFGTLLLAVSVVLMQFINWMSYGIDGLAFAAESLVGKYKGRGSREALESVIRLSFGWGLFFALLYSFGYGVFGTDLVRVFTDRPEVIAATGKYRLWLIIIPLAGFASYIWDGVFIGLTASRAMRNAMVVPCIVFVGVYFGFRHVLGLHALLLALTLFLLGRGLIQTWMYRSRGAEIR